jgi:choline dehydrogenase-like flavoprotein
MTGDVPVGLGNEHDLVGRYFMEHLHAEIGRFVIRRPLTWMLVYAPTPKLVAEAHSLNFGLRVGDFEQWNAGDFTGAMKTCAAEFGGQLAASNVGRLKIVDWLLAGSTPTLAQLAGGNHHMGTTRMRADPKTGVVDADCRVHSLANLYVGGSSVFSTSGHANPTYSIVQLALRLGDHLSGKLKG